MLKTPVLQGHTIVLHPLNEQHAAAMFASFADPEVLRLTGTHETFTQAQVTEHCTRVASFEDRVDYSICLCDTPQETVGEVVLNSIDGNNLSASFRISLFDQHFFNCGYGSEATAMMLKFGFEQLKLHRIELEVYAFNPRVLQVAKIRSGSLTDSLEPR